MRDRLIELLKKLDFDYGEECVVAAEDGYKCAPDFAEYFADHLLANGVIMPPCKVGDSVYEIEKNCLGCLHFTDGGYSDWCGCTLDDSKLMFECDFDKECLYHIIPKKFTYGMIEQFGKTVFLTREQAEKALVERSRK